MIQEAYVSYEVAKLLKEKGFNEPYNYFYKFDSRDIYYGSKLTNLHRGDKFYNAPTHQMAMAWLRKEHKLSATIGFGNGLRSTCFYMSIVKMEPGAKHLSATMRFETYEEAVEAALKYALENLI